MRDQLDNTLVRLAEKDDRVRLVVADIGRFREYSRRYPERLINVGVAEANAVGVAAGLASEGLRVFIYSVAGFIIHRGLEQIRYSIGFWNQPVCLFGTGFGWQYCFIGRGHHAPMDTNLLPGIAFLSVQMPPVHGHQPLAGY